MKRFFVTKMFFKNISGLKTFLKIKQKVSKIFTKKNLKTTKNY